MIRGALLAGLFLLPGPAAAQGPASRVESWRPGGLATRLEDVGPAIRACWKPPPAFEGFERAEVTVRFALRADGSLLGEPRVTYATAPGDGPVRALLARSAIAAVQDCTPVALDKGLGAALAGRPFSLRFIHQGRSGRGV